MLNSRFNDFAPVSNSSDSSESNLNNNCKCNIEIDSKLSKPNNVNNKAFKSKTFCVSNSDGILIESKELAKNAIHSFTVTFEHKLDNDSIANHENISDIPSPYVSVCCGENIVQLTQSDAYSSSSFYSKEIKTVVIQKPQYNAAKALTVLKNIVFCDIEVIFDLKYENTLHFYDKRNKNIASVKFSDRKIDLGCKFYCGYSVTDRDTTTRQCFSIKVDSHLLKWRRKLSNDHHSVSAF